MNTLKVIESRAQKIPWTGCWIWMGETTASGYGQLRLGSKRPIRAHRAAYSAVNGAIPDGAYILHRCGVKYCCRPDHLYAGTQAQNILDSVRHGTHNMARKTHCPQGHPYDADNTIRNKLPSGGFQRDCRACFNAKRRKRRAARKAVEQSKEIV